MSNNNRRSGKSQLTLPLFVAGSQGWVNPQPRIVLKVGKNVGEAKEGERGGDNPQPRIALKIGKNLDTLTTKQLQERLNIRDRDLCPINGVVPWQVYLLWHQGRDRWILYKKVAF